MTATTAQTLLRLQTVAAWAADMCRYALKPWRTGQGSEEF